jgi:hypothetical protein
LCEGIHFAATILQTTVPDNMNVGVRGRQRQDTAAFAMAYGTKSCARFIVLFPSTVEARAEQLSTQAR